MNRPSDKKITILFVNLYTEIAGGEIAVYNTVKGLDKSRFHPIMLFNKRGPFVDKVEEAGIETVVLPYPVVMLQKLIVPSVMLDVMRSSGVLKQMVRERNVDLIHCVDVLSLILIARCSVGTRIPVVYNVIFFYEWTRLALFNLCAWFLVDTIITNSRAIRNDLLTRTIFLARKTQVIYYGVDPHMFHRSGSAEGNAVREELRIAPGTMLVGMIARFDVWKGHLTFLKAAALIRRQRPDVQFVIVGGLLNAEIITPLKKYYNDVMQCHRELDLGGTVQFLSHRNDIPEVLRGLDVFVCPSDREPIPFTVFEAMATGIPIVAADSGGIPEQINHDENGLLFATNDHVSLAAAILRLLDAPAERDRLGAAARRKVETDFSLTRFVSEMETVYEHALAA